MNNKIKIEVLETMAEASSSSADRHELRMRLRTLHDRELRNSERKQFLMLVLINFFLLALLISLSANVWKPLSPSLARPTSHVVNQTLWQWLSAKPASTPERGLFQ